MGLGSVVRKDLPGPALRLERWGGTTGTFTGLDSFDRIVDQQWVSTGGGGANVFDIQHGYDRDSNRTFAKNTTQGSASHVYAYDDLNRLSDDKKGQINSGNTDIAGFWSNGPKSWALDLLGSPATETVNGNGSYVSNTVNSQNQITARKVRGDTYAPAFWAGGTGSAGDWDAPGSGDAFSVSGATLTVGTVAADTFSGHTEDQARGVVLHGQAMGAPEGMGVNINFPGGTTAGQAGLVFGYQSANDYWMLVADMDQHIYLYHVVNGTRSSVSSQSATVTAGSNVWVGFQANSTGLAYPFTTIANGYPGGRVGVVTNVANTGFSSFDCHGGSPRTDVGSRWETDMRVIGSDSRVTFNTYPSSSELLLKNLRLQKFQATFAVRMPNAGDDVGQVRFLFDAQDNGEACDWVTVVHGKSGSWMPNAYASAGSGSMTSFAYHDAGYDPGFTTLAYDDVVWTRVQSDGSTVKVWFIIKAAAGAAPTESDWTAIAASPALNTSTGLNLGGGRLGFANAAGSATASVDDLTVKSYDGSSWVTELVEPFTLDGSGYIADTLAYDSNGNLTYDGTQAYTYDAWNRQITVAHAYRDSGGTLHSGQVNTTCTYDPAGRRIIKAITTTGNWDATLHAYYSAGYQIIEERNGSDQSIKDHLWGLTYVDEAIQTRINTTPSSTATWSSYYPLQDANFNVLGVTDSSGVLKERYEYGAYGFRQVFTSSGTNDPGCFAASDASSKVITSGSVIQPYGLNDFGHQGLIHDEYTNLVYNRARYLHPTLGRFCQEDPLGCKDGMNYYGYCAGNSMNYIDPTGLSFKDDLMKIVNVTWEYVEVVPVIWGGANPDVQAGFDEGNWDRSNGTIEGLTWGNIDLDGWNGGDPSKKAYIFDPKAREQNRCFSQCVGNTLVSNLIPKNPGFNVNPFGRKPGMPDWTDFTPEVPNSLFDFAPIGITNIEEAAQSMKFPQITNNIWLPRTTGSGRVVKQSIGTRLIRPEGGWESPKLISPAIKDFKLARSGTSSFQLANQNTTGAKVAAGATIILYLKQLEECRKKCFCEN